MSDAPTSEGKPAHSGEAADEREKKKRDKSKDKHRSKDKRQNEEQQNELAENTEAEEVARRNKQKQEKDEKKKKQKKRDASDDSDDDEDDDRLERNRRLDARHAESEAGANEEGSGDPDNNTTGGGLTDNRPRVVIDPTKDLWQNIALNVRDSGSDTTETNVLMVGASDAGKTTLLQRIYTTFTSSAGGGGGGSGAAPASKKVKPTTALDYSFARRTDRNSAQVAHFWELAQGIDLAQLSDVIVTPDNIHAMVLCVVVEASDGPNGVSVMWETATYWLKRLDRRVSEILTRMRAKGSSTPDKMANRAQKLLGSDHPDLKRMRISGVPTVLVVNKMDRFTGDSSKLKLLCQSMRFLAHLYGAHLIFTAEDESSAKWRLLMSHLLFQAPFDTRHVQFDPERGHVLITADKDTFTDIGDPPIMNFANVQRGSTSGDGELDRWGAPFDAAFPPKRLSPSGSVGSPHAGGGGASSSAAGVQDDFIKKLYEVSEDGFGEPTIDALRRQKEEELEQYRKSMKTKERNAGK